MITLSGYQWSGRFLGIPGWDPSVCKSHRLHVDILRFSFIKLGHILYIPLKWWVIFLQSWWTSTVHFSNSTGSSATNCRFFAIIAGYMCAGNCVISLHIVFVAKYISILTWHCWVGWVGELGPFLRHQNSAVFGPLPHHLMRKIYSFLPLQQSWMELTTHLF